tara:strand:- start:2771 stop:3706 length:936 start_codon:yes stop_codon:yes gene_type:complete
LKEAFKIYYHPIYTSGINKTSNFPRERYKLLYEKLKPYERTLSIKLKKSEMVNKDYIKKVHDVNYVDNFLNGTLSEKEIRKIGLKPWTNDIIERTLRITGGSISAMKNAISCGGFSANMAGGTHHAHKSFGSGFCIFNDIAICSYVAMKELNIKNIMVIDLDVHQGDGTATILKKEKRVFTFSMHCSSNFPFEKCKSDLDISLPKDTGDKEYIIKLEEAMRYLKNIPSDLILFQAGVDGLSNDRYGNFKLTQKGLMERNKIVFEFAKIRKNPLCIFMGGGYSIPIEHTISAFEDLFILASKFHNQIIFNYV